MGHKTVLIVPATVPDAKVTRLTSPEPPAPFIISSKPGSVPLARAIRIVPEQLTVEQVAQLRAENEALRQEMARVLAS